MGTVVYCDTDDCQNTREEQKMYSFADEETAKRLYLRKYDDICQECVDEFNVDYEEDNPLVISDKYNILSINPKAKECVDE